MNFWRTFLRSAALFRVAATLLLSLGLAQGAQVVVWFVNPQTGLNDTNYFIAEGIAPNSILSSGGIQPTALPFRLYPAANGLATNYFGLGWYAVWDQAIQPAQWNPGLNQYTLPGGATVINVTDSSQAQYAITNSGPGLILESGFNTYAVTVIGTNQPNFTMVTNALAGQPVMGLVNTVGPGVANFGAGSWGVSTNYDGLGAAAAVLGFASGVSNTVTGNQAYAVGVSNLVLTVNASTLGYAVGVSNLVIVSSNGCVAFTGSVSNLVITTSNGVVSFTAGVSNNVVSEHAYAVGVSNIVVGNQLFAVGISNLVLTVNASTLGYAVGVSNLVISLNTATLGYAVGVSNIVAGNQLFSIGVSNLVIVSSNGCVAFTGSVSNLVITTSNGVVSFTAGVSNNVVSEHAYAMGVSNIVVGNQAYAVGVSNLVLTVNVSTLGYAVGMSNLVVKVQAALVASNAITGYQLAYTQGTIGQDVNNLVLTGGGTAAANGTNVWQGTASGPTWTNLTAVSFVSGNLVTGAVVYVSGLAVYGGPSPLGPFTNINGSSPAPSAMFMVNSNAAGTGITISKSFGVSTFTATASQPLFGNGTNTVYSLNGGTNSFNVPSTTFDAPGASAAVLGFASGVSNTVTGNQAYAVGVSNLVLTVNASTLGYAVGVSNLVIASSNGCVAFTGSVSNLVITTSNGVVSFTAGVSNNVVSEHAYAVGVSNIVVGNQLFAVGVSNLVLTVNASTLGYAVGVSNNVVALAAALILTNNQILTVTTQLVQTAQMNATNFTGLTSNALTSALIATNLLLGYQLAYTQGTIDRDTNNLVLSGGGTASANGTNVWQGTASGPTWTNLNAVGVVSGNLTTGAVVYVSGIASYGGPGPLGPFTNIAGASPAPVAAFMVKSNAAGIGITLSPRVFGVTTITANASISGLDTNLFTQLSAENVLVCPVTNLPGIYLTNPFYFSPAVGTNYVQLAVNSLPNYGANRTLVGGGKIEVVGQNFMPVPLVFTNVGGGIMNFDLEVPFFAGGAIICATNPAIRVSFLNTGGNFEMKDLIISSLVNQTTNLAEIGRGSVGQGIVGTVDMENNWFGYWPYLTNNMDTYGHAGLTPPTTGGQIGQHNLIISIDEPSTDMNVYKNNHFLGIQSLYLSPDHCDFSDNFFSFCGGSYATHGTNATAWTNGIYDLGAAVILGNTTMNQNNWDIENTHFYDCYAGWYSQTTVSHKAFNTYYEGTADISELGSLPILDGVYWGPNGYTCPPADSMNGTADSLVNMFPNLGNQDTTFTSIPFNESFEIGDQLSVANVDAASGDANWIYVENAVGTYTNAPMGLQVITNSTGEEMDSMLVVDGGISPIGDGHSAPGTIEIEPLSMIQFNTNGAVTITNRWSSTAVTLNANAMTANVPYDSSSFVVVSNHWSLSGYTNGQPNFATIFASSNGVPVAIYSSNGVAYVYYMTPAEGGILP